MHESLDKFLLLMWKNGKIQLRNHKQTFFEIVGPVTICVILVLVRGFIESTHYPERIYPCYKPEFTNNPELALFEQVNLAFAPNSTKITKIVNDAFPKSKSKEPFENNEQLEKYLTKLETPLKVGILFHGNMENELPSHINFSLRYPAELPDKSTWETDTIFPFIITSGPRDQNNSFTANPDYYRTAFLFIQKALSSQIISELSPTSEPQIGVELCRYPYPEYYTDPLMPILAVFMPFLITVAFIYTALNIIKVITVEKELQLKESMKIMGLSTTLHWLAWFAKSFIFMFIIIVLMVALLKIDFYSDEFVPAVFPNCDVLLMFLFLLFYVCAMITFCFAVSVFFTRANIASIIGSILFFFTFVPFMILQSSYHEMTLSEKMASSLLLGTAMGYGFNIFCSYESAGQGLQWNNLYRPVTPDDTLTMGHIFLMLIIDIIVYMLIALYVEAVFPGRYGVPKKWNFIFTWMWRRNSKVTENFDNIRNNLDSTTFEKEPDNLEAGVDIRHLRKVFGKDKVAVHDLSMKMFHNQITVLLGHNGAGKTTTLSMLTGMYSPTSGHAIINGYDICTNISKVRRSLGLCPQHNILFDDLTVAEHIYFFSRLKGMQKSEIKKEIDTFINLLELNDKRNVKSNTLSGGMKRKLSVANAFCGNAKVVMLDEPTAGMDPAARRKLWDLIEVQKEGKTILLTTHFMDEADLLGDRIAIMAGGKLQCCGSSFFLKKRYGAGYRLIMEKAPSCNVDQITGILKEYIPDINVVTDIGSELTYLLPQDKSHLFKDMLQNLEYNSRSLGILSYGISLTTLEEVFLKVGADFGQEEEVEENHNQDIKQNKLPEVHVDVGNNNTLTGFALTKNHIYAMFLKRFLITKRSWAQVVPLFLLPILFIIFAMLSDRVPTKKLPMLPLTLDYYKDPITMLSAKDKETNEYLKSAKNWLNKHSYDYSETEDMVPTMLKITKENSAGVKFSYIVGASFENNKITGWYNNDPCHSPPVALNLVMNSILQKNTNNEYSISVNNYPLPFTIDTQLEKLQSMEGGGFGFNLAFNISICMSVIMSLYIIFYIRERVCKAKHLQIITGLNILVFWGVTFFWDCITYILAVLCLIVTLSIYQTDGFSTFSELGDLALLLLAYGFGMLPLIYLFSFKFSLPSSGFIRMSYSTMFIGTIAFMVVIICRSLNFILFSDISDWVLIFTPSYALPHGIYNLYNEFNRVKNCKLIVEFCENNTNNICKYPECKELTVQYYKWGKDGILRNIIIMFLVGFLLIFILLLKEFNIFSRIRYLMNFQRLKNLSQISNSNNDEDDDVEEEKSRVRNMPAHEINQNTLILKDLTKYYGNYLAVNRLCLGVKQYECFGLLGINGAGKTTTFRMMTGDTSITFGDIFVNGIDLKSHLKEANKSIGYCPQFDALLDDLTARETLKIFSLLRGYTKMDSNVLGENLARDFDFYRHLDKKVRQMSGGNKRKLSAAVALIGNPSIVYLDEPTAGMDPATKRFLWNVLCKLRDNGKCLILTSHNMEECEALCTRLAIMANGTFKCIGSTQHLKNKFTNGYSLIIKLRKSDSPTSLDEIVDYVQSKFPNAEVREKHQELITFFITKSEQKWSEMFGILEEAKTRLNIEDYSIGQSSLEQVFLSFTN